MSLSTARHVRARSETRYVGPHWTTTQTYKITKAARGCGDVGKAEKSYTELSEIETLRRGGETFSVVLGCSYMTYILRRPSKAL